MLFRSALLSVAFWAVFLAGLRLTVVPPETCGQDNLPAIQSAATQAIGWIERNQLPDGAFVYEYDANTNKTSADYNDVPPGVSKRRQPLSEVIEGPASPAARAGRRRRTFPRLSVACQAVSSNEVGYRDDAGH